MEIQTRRDSDPHCHFPFDEVVGDVDEMIASREDRRRVEERVETSGSGDP